MKLWPSVKCIYWSLIRTNINHYFLLIFFQCSQNTRLFRKGTYMVIKYVKLFLIRGSNNLLLDRRKTVGLLFILWCEIQMMMCPLQFKNYRISHSHNSFSYLLKRTILLLTTWNFYNSTSLWYSAAAGTPISTRISMHHDTPQQAAPSKHTGTLVWRSSFPLFMAVFWLCVTARHLLFCHT